MERARRHAYLRAMGITPWVPRGDGAAVPAPALAGPTVAAVEPTSEVPGGQVAEGPSNAPLTQVRADALDPGDSVASLEWEDLAATVAACRACGLCETRTQTVFGVGSRGAQLLVIGEAPGADEDRAGEPFVGRAGQLLNRMLAAIGLEREQVYIANILKCRPPGNRDPRPDEVLRCLPYLMRQIELIGPRIVLAVGRISAQTLLGTDLPLGRLRGRWLELGSRAIPLRVTYHPAYLLRSPDQKARAWEDLTAVARRLGA
ncbi:MAG: uracil-DNA glycosylase [Bdellovibrio bacteriovorus]